MKDVPTYDAIIIGGGPAGSTCAAFLLKSGVHTLLIDRAKFPRVKLCAGWLSSPVWDILELSFKEYPLGLWEWNKIHIHFRGRKYTLASKGYFIRRCEFDDFLLQRSKVETVQGYNVRQIKQDEENYWVIDNKYRARHLIGAGGSHCPVARTFFPKHENPPCGTQENEFEGNENDIEACRAGGDGEPKILFHDDMKGYSWNVPKSNWLNIGTGTKVATEVHPAWNKARSFFEANGTIPVSSRSTLDKMKGHGYYGFDTKRLEFCQSGNVFLVGDALGLAQPMTGEGILPALLSGKLCALAVADGKPIAYREQLCSHSIISSYRVLHSIQTIVSRFTKNNGENRLWNLRLFSWLFVKIFAALFSGRQIPGSRLMTSLSTHR